MATVVSTLILVVSACSGDDDPEAAEVTPTTEATTKTTAEPTTDTVGAGCGAATAEPGTERIEFASGDDTYEVERVVPPTYDGTTPRPLIVDLHGFAQHLGESGAGTVQVRLHGPGTHAHHVGHLGHRQARLLDELLGQQHAPCLRHRHRRGAQVLFEKPAQLPFAHAQPSSQRVYVAHIHRPGLDHGQRPRNRVGRPPPSPQVGRSLRPASQAGPEPRLLRRRRRAVEGHVLALGRPRRADWPTVDPGRLDPAEHTAIEPRIAGEEGAVAGVVIHIHDMRMGARSLDVSRFSDIVVRSLAVFGPHLAISAGRKALRNLEGHQLAPGPSLP